MPTSKGVFLICSAFEGFYLVCCLAFVAICHGRSRPLTRVHGYRDATRGEFIIKRPRERDRTQTVNAQSKSNHTHNQGQRDRDLHLDGCPGDWQAFINASEIRNKQLQWALGNDYH